MEIPVIVKSIQIVKEGFAAEAIIEFNSIEFKANLFSKGINSELFDLDILGLDIKNLEKAGIFLDLSELQRKYVEILREAQLSKEEAKIQYREKTYVTSRLHELKELLDPYYSIMSLEEYQESKSGALYAFYKYPYRECCKEISIFMDRDKFVVYDQLNEETISDFSSEPEEVKKAIDDHIKAWKHKVDFKLALVADVNGHVEKDPTKTISATEYFQQLQTKEKTHEDEVRKNHQQYLEMLGKLGDSKEIQAHADKHAGIDETGSIDKKRLLGSLSDTKKIKIRHLFDNN